MADQEIRIRLTADGAAQAGAAFTRAGTDLRKIGDAGKFTSQQMAQVNMQLTDIAVSLGSGQSPFTVLLQQGGQLKDMFGGVGGAARALGAGVVSAINPFTVAAGIVGGFAVAAYQGAEESSSLRRSLLLTGNAAGVTAEGVDILSRSVAEHADTTIGAAREITAGLVATGQVGGSAIGVVSEAAARLAEVTGQSAGEVVKEFASMSSGVANWAAQHNKSWHFVNAAQLDHIRTLEEAGDATGAMIAVGQALNDHLARQRDNLGWLEAAWHETSKAASSFWDDALDLGRADTAIEKINDARDSLEELRRMLASPVTGGLASLIFGTEAQGQARVDTANRDALRGHESALTAGADAEEQARLSKLRESLRAITGRLSGETSRYQQELRNLIQAEEEGLITEERRLELTRQIAVEQGKGIRPEAKASKRDFLGEAEEGFSRRLQQWQESDAAARDKFEQEQEEGWARILQRDAEKLQRRNEQAEQFGLQLVEETAQINISLIEDDRERGLAQIELERQAVQGRLDVLAAGGADITAAQEALNANILAKQKALNASMKSEFDSLHRHAEDVFAALVSGEQIDVQGLFKAVMAEQARETYRKDLAPMVEKGGKALLDFFGLGGGAGGKKADSPGSEAVDDWAAEFGNLIGITDRQAEAADGSARAMATFGAAADALGSIFGETSGAVAQWVAMLMSSSGSSSGSGWGALIASFFSGSSSSTGSGVTSGNTGLVDYGLGGGRAIGGPVSAGWEYTVGETGPEKLRMYRGGGGHVTPMPAHAAAAGGGTTVHNHHYEAGVSPAQMHAYGEALANRLRGETLESAARYGRPLNRASRRY